MAGDNLEHRLDHLVVPHDVDVVAAEPSFLDSATPQTDGPVVVLHDLNLGTRGVEPRLVPPTRGAHVPEAHQRNRPVAVHRRHPALNPAAVHGHVQRERPVGLTRPVHVVVRALGRFADAVEAVDF